MMPGCAKTQSRMYGAVGLIAVAGAVLFLGFGNATRGYVNTASLPWWWISQWIDPRAETEHGWLILGLSVWMFGRNLRRTLSQTPSAADERGTASVSPRSVGENVWVPACAIAAALAIHAIGFVAQQSRISIVGLLVFFWGVLAFVNRRYARAAAFPLGFMVFAIPLNVLDSVGFWLRLAVIDVTADLARLAGIGVVRSGTQLFAVDGSYQYDVAAACSGVRSLMALAALSLLVGYLNFKSWWRRGLMLVLCFPLTFLGNVLRVALIVLAAHLGGQQWGERVHNVMGYGVFVIVLGGVMGAAAGVGRWWPETPTEKTPRLSAKAQPGRFTLITILAATMLMIAGEMVFLAHLSSGRERGRAGVRLDATGDNPAELPAFLGTEWIGRTAEVTAVERATLPADTGFSRRTYLSVQDKSHSVFLSIVLSGRDRTSIHRPELCLVGQGWTIVGAASHAFALSSGTHLPVTVLQTRLQDRGTAREVRALVAYWFVSSDAIVATHWQRFLHDAWNRLRHGRADRWAYVLLQADAPDGEVAALERMQAVLNGTVSGFQEVLPP
ncbi:MAG: exosortase C-terminal domain/associated protein EpsI [Opitutus sp.]